MQTTEFGCRFLTNWGLLSWKTGCRLQLWTVRCFSSHHFLEMLPALSATFVSSDMLLLLTWCVLTATVEPALVSICAFQSCCCYGRETTEPFLLGYYDWLFSTVSNLRLVHVWREFLVESSHGLIYIYLPTFLYSYFIKNCVVVRSFVAFSPCNLSSL